MTMHIENMRPALPSTGGARIRQVKPGGWQVYHLRATETLHAVQCSAEAQEWSAVIAIAPVSALAAAQAVTAQRAGVISRPDDYNTAVELLLIHGAELPDMKLAMESLRHLLERKITVQHGAEPASEPVAREIMRSTARFVEWAGRVLTAPAG